jgi:hypothetical protein
MQLLQREPRQFGSLWWVLGLIVIVSVCHHHAYAFASVESRCCESTATFGSFASAVRARMAYALSTELIPVHEGGVSGSQCGKPAADPLAGAI